MSSALDESKNANYGSQKKKKNIQKHANPHDFDLSYNKGGRHSQVQPLDPSWLPNWLKIMSHLPRSIFLVE